MFINSIHPLIKFALAEDEARHDRTTRLLVPPEKKGKARIVTHEKCVVAGLNVGQEIFRKVDPKLRYKPLVREGERYKPKTALVEVSGSLRSILRAERTVLNFMQRLCSVATTTRDYVEAVRDYPVTLWDTRKTIPGWRELDKYAVRVGGGQNHRSSLKTGILIKDNHLLACEGIPKAVERLRKGKVSLKTVVLEIDSLQQFREALDLGFQHILLDNFTPERLKKAVQLNRGRAILEASGGITLKNVKKIAATGIDRISIGALTHSPPAINLSLEISYGT